MKDRTGKRRISINHCCCGKKKNEFFQTKGMSAMLNAAEMLLDPRAEKCALR